ncbi:right-handed parallel beta-helix repeat-containing protein [Flavonifractor sp. An10]|uniref:right-handed parallel beta-helix repeat-containing protein n=1 Tax=Flavonifractor sp. An10 TaxID=1965537 RepID=UPI000B38F433|nr:right-handed parallel beta-helix repeat-containing protein [Flavonifractor sp. An10]OUQ81938.1 hypothetical protein B5E42_10290 [Flavonifractor sp. An10]
MRRKSLLSFMLSLSLLLSALPLTAYATLENDAPPTDPPPVSEPTEDSPQIPEVTTLEELLAAIDAAESGDTIALNNQIYIDQNCVIGDTEKVITLIPGDTFTAGTFLTVSSFAEQDVTIQNLNLDGQGAALSAIVVNHTSLDDIVGQFEMSNINISNFASTNRPVILSAVTATVSNCTFSDNTGRRTAGIELSSNSTAIIESCTFTDNTSAGNGGAILCMGQLELRNSQISNNQAGVEVDRPCVGGSIYISNTGSGLLYNCTITGNNANLGGGISTDGKLEIVDSLIFGNTGAMGASDIYAPSNTPLSISYTNGMDSIYTENDPVGYYADYFENAFDPENNAVFLGESLSIEKVDTHFGAKFVFASDLPEEPEPEPIPPEQDTPDSSDTPSDPEPVKPSDPGTPDKPDIPDSPDESDEPEEPEHSKDPEPDTSDEDTPAPSRPHRPSHSDTPAIEITEPVKLVLSCGDAVLDPAVPLFLAGYGDGQAHENDLITRAQIAVLLYRSLTPASVAMLSGDYDTFSDVERGTWYYAAVSALASAGIVSGYNGFFRPDDTLTSGELITMLTRFVEAKTAPMPWVSYQGHWSYPSIVTAVSYGWIEDVSEIDPDRPVARGEAVAWVNSIFELC